MAKVQGQTKSGRTLPKKIKKIVLEREKRPGRIAIDRIKLDVPYKGPIFQAAQTSASKKAEHM